jgi:hypothetical protein
VVGEAMHAGCIPFITKESGVNFDSSSGHYLNDKSPTEIAQTIEQLLSDRKEQMMYASFVQDSIELIEQSYLPDLLNLYEFALVSAKE